MSSSEPVSIKYKVVYVSGAEESPSPDLDALSNLLASESSGWISSKYCHYPQELVLKLKERSNLDKIQVLCHHLFIPTQIEFWIGTSPVGERLSWSKAKFDRLGYANFRDNKDTGYKSREHKTIYVDNSGWFLKLKINENFKNEFNQYNQVGICGLTISGFPLGEKDSEASGLSEDEEDYKDQIKKEKAKMRQTPLSAKEIKDLKSTNERSDSEEMREIIKLLESKKREAVREERFEQAKKYKTGIDQLKEALKDLDKLNTDKREAIEEENFDKAIECKEQMDNIKKRTYDDIDLMNMLTDKEAKELGLDKKPKPASAGPKANSPTPKTNSASRRSATKNNYDDRVLPTIAHKNQARRSSVPRQVGAADKDEKLPPINSSRSSSVMSQPDVVDNNENQVMMAEQGQGRQQPEEEEGGDDEEAIYKQIPEKEQSEYSQAIQLFGAKTVRSCTAKKWESRQKGLVELQRQLDESQSDDREEAYSRLMAALQLLRRGLRDKIYAVYRQALTLLNYILKTYLPKHQIVKTGGNLTAEKTHYILITRTGDTITDPRFRSSTFENSLNIVRNGDVQTRKAYVSCFLRPFQATGYPKIDEGHAELAEQIITNSGPDPNIDLTEAKICPFAISCLQHTDANVRQSGIRILTHTYKSGDKEKVRKYLPPDNETTKKKWPLYKVIFEEFDRIDGKPVEKPSKGKGKSKEDDDVEQLKKMNKELKAALTKRNSTEPANNRQRTRRASEPSATSDQSCVFCGETNSKFDEETLDLHYLKYCPMLMKCQYCKKIVEISSLKEHYMKDCSASDKFRQCPRCKEPLQEDEYNKHQTQQKCPIAKPPQVAERCLMCHKDVSPNSEQGWRKHLIGATGCPGNPRKTLGIGASGSKRRNSVRRI